jgi:hypothetical protein
LQSVGRLEGRSCASPCVRHLCSRLTRRRRYPSRDQRALRIREGCEGRRGVHRARHGPRRIGGCDTNPTPRCPCGAPTRTSEMLVGLPAVNPRRPRPAAPPDQGRWSSPRLEPAQCCRVRLRGPGDGSAEGRAGRPAVLRAARRAAVAREPLALTPSHRYRRVVEQLSSHTIVRCAPAPVRGTLARPSRDRSQEGA